MYEVGLGRRWFSLSVGWGLAVQVYIQARHSHAFYLLMKCVGVVRMIRVPGGTHCLCSSSCIWSAQSSARHGEATVVELVGFDAQAMYLRACCVQDALSSRFRLTVDVIDQLNN